VPVKLGGMVPLTTVDYPDHLACVLFCQGCAWRCHYCHNPELLGPVAVAPLPWSQVLEFLHRRRGLLQAVVFSGGEATLQPGLAQAMQQVRKLGFKVGLHSAGIKPSALARVLPLCDWVGLDIKAPRGRADAITQIIGSDAAGWDSMNLLLASGVPCEIRTTVNWSLLCAADVLQLARQLRQAGVSNFSLQLARNNICLNQLPTQPPPAQLPSLLNQLQQIFPAGFKYSAG